MAKKAEETGEKTISKAEAVRKALAEGLESPDEGTAYIKEKFGLDIAKPVFSSYKSQEKNKAAGKAPAAPKAAATKASNGDMVDDVEAIKHLVDRLGGAKVKRIVGLFE